MCVNNAALVARILLATLLLALLPQIARATEAEQLAKAAKIVGPDGNDDNACSKCHTLETEAWQNSHHFSSFEQRHQTERAKEILMKMDLKSMKHQTECRQCHYTSVVDDGKLVPTWGVSCESCHDPAADWVNIHNKLGGDPDAAMLRWGTGKNETPAERHTRLDPARAKSMVNARMIYELATNCLACHTVPDETLINKGGHKAGSDFDLVAWSQGEVRHNFADSPGAPDDPANRRSTPAELRRLYIVGTMVDLQFSLRNLLAATKKGGDYQKAMIDRVNRIRAKAAAIMSAVALPEFADALKVIPEKIEDSASIARDLPEKLATATKEFADKNDGTKLGVIDGLIPKQYVGAAYKE